MLSGEADPAWHEAKPPTTGPVRPGPTLQPRAAWQDYDYDYFTTTSPSCRAGVGHPSGCTAAAAVKALRPPPRLDRCWVVRHDRAVTPALHVNYYYY